MQEVITLMEKVLNDFVDRDNLLVRVRMSKSIRSRKWRMVEMRQTTLDEFGFDLGIKHIIHPNEFVYSIHPVLLKTENVIDTYSEIKKHLDNKLFSLR
tara:strand:+ start:62 stop:355 length:294 start_codon:yes stop_codon:yes gene_type:complete